MIIHASLKTDIAQFYSDWIIKRLKEGFIDIPSEKQINRYDFAKNKLSKIYFWSKDPQSLFKHNIALKELKYDYEIITELSLYDKCYEPKIKSKQRIMEDIRKNSKFLGKDKVSFCYGPIFTTFNCPIEWHVFQFKFLCEQLHEYVNNVYISYEISNTCLNAKNYNIKKITQNDKQYLFKKFKEIADSFNLNLLVKPETTELTEEEIDIGEINTCPAACIYCVGINNKKTIKLKNEKHKPYSSLLIGDLDYDAKIKNIELISKSKQKLNTNQDSLFDF
jgi:hypothetical protein